MQSTQYNSGKVSKIAVVCGGGPAPGMNSVIRAVSFEALRLGIEVIGIEKGFYWLARGDSSHVVALNARRVENIHTRGGTILGTSREAPTRDPEKMKRAVEALKSLNIDALITIGGDDTASTAAAMAKALGIRLSHVPKTIDNDLPLPNGINTFGYESARSEGVRIMSTLQEDARTTERWYLVVAMGRSAGHLALGIGAAAMADVTIIPEEFRSKKIGLSHLSRIIEGTIIKKRSTGRGYGVAIVAEGVAECIVPEDLSVLKDAPKDEHGHVRLAEVPLGSILKKQVSSSLAERDLKTTIVSKDVGYELRCVSPCAIDITYTQDLGTMAVRSVIEHADPMLVCVIDGHQAPLPLASMINPETGRMNVRRVDVDTAYYGNARRYMNRLHVTDTSDEAVAQLAEFAGCSAASFRDQFESVSAPW